jgi:hypothetical protein
MSWAKSSSRSSLCRTRSGPGIEACTEVSEPEEKDPDVGWSRIEAEMADREPEARQEASRFRGLLAVPTLRAVSERRRALKLAAGGCREDLDTPA